MIMRKVIEGHKEDLTKITINVMEKVLIVQVVKIVGAEPLKKRKAMKKVLKDRGEIMKIKKKSNLEEEVF